MITHIRRSLGGGAAAVTAAGLAILVTAAATTTPAYGGMHAPAACVLSEGGPAGSDSPGTVTPINTATNTPGKAITVTTSPMSSMPAEIAFTPNGNTAYVVVSAVVGAGSLGVVPIKTATNKPGKAIYVGLFPGPIVITPNGKTVYAASQSGLTPIRTATNKPGKAIKGVTGPIAITRDGRTIYAASGASTVTPVSTATDKPGKAIKVGLNPLAVVITP